MNKEKPVPDKCEKYENQRMVGGSIRADGSVRKTYKIRPGYTPPEEVQRYVPRAKRFQGTSEPIKSGKITVKNLEEFPALGSKSSETKLKDKHENTNETLERNNTKQLRTENIDKLMEGLCISQSTEKEVNKKSLYIPPWKRKSQSK
ncbi:uncharacterized protein SAPINGB_P005612 [Magnusiomyces paraingens]|uniref:WIBG Mago-binding domain-containing protein n=1 Tax=Magnusiomyces paraingens TaxID=2606893 RepID=A0A5E8C7Q6_9ASCO|nr:uncharacterized protein SAPINGB_P005612 [Saprochaete ingens]VVT57256.1 unnamed protein product [Saprochaete ingens]